MYGSAFVLSSEILGERTEKTLFLFAKEPYAWKNPERTQETLFFLQKSPMC